MKSFLTFVKEARKAATHFVGFKNPKDVDRAARVFGKPDFLHRKWDDRARHGGEYDPKHDRFVFAKGTEHDPPSKNAVDDSNGERAGFTKKYRKNNP